MGLHDLLDGLLTFRETEHAIAKMPANPGVTDLSAAIDLLSTLCQQRDWTTADPLGLGGLLFDACRLCGLIGDQRDYVRLLEEVIQACHDGLVALLASPFLNRPASHRLAFRELGLAIGLRASPIIADAIAKERNTFVSRPALRRSVDLLLPYQSLSQAISSASGCRTPSIRMRVGKTTKISDDVMLATALIPDMFLLVGNRVPLMHHL